MVIKCTNIYYSKAKIYTNWDFWFENKPSGKPGWRAGKSDQLMIFGEKETKDSVSTESSSNTCDALQQWLKL
jgi:hypothetical protein